MVLILGEYAFDRVATIAVERDESGTVIEYRPQDLYTKKDTSALHKDGAGPFCQFRIDVPPCQSGVYAILVDGALRYVGEALDLRKRFNSGYGLISPRNCYVRGQLTNCRINTLIYNEAFHSRILELYFHPTSDRKAIEREIIREYQPGWNRKLIEKSHLSIPD